MQTSKCVKAGSKTHLIDHHRAVAAALVHRQNCTSCVSYLKIDVDGAASSVGEKLDAAMLHGLNH